MFLLSTVSKKLGGSQISKKKINTNATGMRILSRGYASKQKSKKGVKVSLGEWTTHKLDDTPATEVEVTKDELIEYYTEMQRVRRMETAADMMYKQKKIRGFLHLYNGQEAVCTGMDSVITREDSVITAYRDHSFMITKRCGGTVKEVLAELTGKKEGCSKGKGGSMHMYKTSSHYYGGNGIVGAQVPLGTGIAFSQKYNKTGNVCLTYYGDGAANQGQLFESYNMAALWKLPCIYICENNRYAMGTSIERSSASTNYYSRGDYVPGIRVDGMNILAVRAAGEYAVNRCREGKGPILLEMVTYRYQGHSMSDPGTTYRTRDEVTSMRQTKDPINYVKTLLLDNDMATKDDFKKIDKDIKAEVDEAVKFAESAPETPAEELFTDVYIEKSQVRATELVNSAFA